MGLFNTYVLQSFQNLEQEIMVQQEEQQQQTRNPLILTRFRGMPPMQTVFAIAGD